MLDPARLAFTRMRRSERTMDLHSVAHRRGLANAAYKRTLAYSEAFRRVDPTTPRGVMLKVKEAIVGLEDHEDPRALATADALRHFFRTRRTLDSAWLRDLRQILQDLLQYAEFLEPDRDYSVECLQSILTGIGTPRLVAAT